MLIGIIAIVFIIGAFLLSLTFSRYNPEEIEVIPLGSREIQTIPESFSICSWNIGYGGLGAEMDFFYEGGKHSRPNKELYQKYFNGILETLKELEDTTDFFCIQEVDISSKRSYRYNQVDSITHHLSGYEAALGINYRCPFIPLPLKDPMGKVKSGLATFSRHPVINALRVKLPENTNWPMKLFHPQRCYVETRYVLNNKELVIINTHNSAFDSGKDREAQIEALVSKAKSEYNKGNFVVVCGDWNSSPPSFQGGSSSYKFPLIKDGIVSDDWTWAYENGTPTNRAVSKPYSMETPTSLIDFFLVSPNLSVMQVKTLDVDFKYSDHNPIYIRLHCKNEIH